MLIFCILAKLLLVKLNQPNLKCVFAILQVLTTTHYSVTAFHKKICTLNRPKNNSYEQKITRNWVFSFTSGRTYLFNLFIVQIFLWIAATTEYYLVVKTCKTTQTADLVGFVFAAVIFAKTINAGPCKCHGLTPTNHLHLSIH